MIAKRFTETVSTGIVTDNLTGKEYKCEMRIDDELLELLNALHEKNQQLSKDKQLAEAELMTYKQRVKDELEMRYCLSNHKPVFEFMAKELDITLEGNLVSYEEHLRRNPMPTKSMDNDNYRIVEVRCEE